MSEGDRHYLFTWLSLGLFVLTGPVGFVVGEGFAAFFAGPDGATLTGWRLALVSLPAFVLFAIPAVLAVGLALRATREGRPGAVVPAGIAVGLVTAFVVLNVAAYVVGGVPV